MNTLGKNRFLKTKKFLCKNFSANGNLWNISGSHTDESFS